MIIKRKTQIILALFVLSVFLFQNCATLSRGTSEGKFPERKQGTIIIIMKKDGQQIEGELITVKKDSLLLFTGVDVSIDVADIKFIRIVKKSKFWTGAGLGFLMGGVLGASLGASYAEKEKSKPYFLAGYMADWAILGYGLGLGAITALLGGLIGASAGRDKTIQIEGMTESEIRKALDKLRKKARIRDYK